LKASKNFCGALRTGFAPGSKLVNRYAPLFYQTSKDISRTFFDFFMKTTKNFDFGHKTNRFWRVLNRKRQQNT
jgi:hypothetical protein